MHIARYSVVFERVNRPTYNCLCEIDFSSSTHTLKVCPFFSCLSCWSSCFKSRVLNCSYRIDSHPYHSLIFSFRSMVSEPKAYERFRAFFSVVRLLLSRQFLLLFAWRMDLQIDFRFNGMSTCTFSFDPLLSIYAFSIAFYLDTSLYWFSLQ